MAAFLRANFAEGILVSGISALDGSITVQAGHNLPVSAGVFRLTIWNSVLYLNPTLDPNVETVTATYSAPNVYSITRAQESTIAHPHLTGDTASLFYTAGVSQDDLTWLGTYQVDETGVSANKILNLSGGKIAYTNSPTLVGLTITGVTGVVKAAAGVLGGGAAHGDLTTIGANDHHNQSHVLNGSDHTVSGLNIGHVLQALSATTFGFAAVPGLHDAVTLATSADVLLGLTGQVLSLDTQAATYVLAGPTSGGVTAPTFRALIATDIPALSYEVPLTFSTGLNRAINNITCIITQYTDALARAAISESVTGLDYNNSTGVLSLTTGYVIPTTTEETNWNSAYSAIHTRQHSITSTSDHTSTATAGQMLKADANGLAVNATNTDTAVAAAVTASHATATVGGDPLSILGQQISFSYNATNLKITSNQLDTIQSIAATAHPTLAGLNLVSTTYPILTMDARLQPNTCPLIYAYADRAENAITFLWLVYDLDSVAGNGFILLRGTTKDKGYMDFYTSGSSRLRIDEVGHVLINKTSGTEYLEVAGKIRADTAFNLNGTDGVTQTASAGKVSMPTAVAGGLVIAQSQITYATDGTYALPTSITISKGIITAIS